MSNLRDTSSQLRDSGFSGSDHFMQQGHQIINTNRANAGMKRKNGDWAKSDKAITELINKVFPKFNTDQRQRLSAGRWIRVIQLFYRSGLSYGDTAKEIGVPTYTIRNILARINRARNNQPCNGNKGLRKRDTSGTS